MDLQGRNLSLGLEGDDVKQLHTLLGQLGSEIPVPEIRKSFFGEGTQRAISILQKAHWLEPTGVVDERTAQVLTILLKLAQLELSSPTDPRNRSQRVKSIVAPLNPGASGDDVTNLQNAVTLLIKREIIRDAKDHPSIDELERLTDGLLSERSEFGASTRQLIVIFQTQQFGENFRGLVEEKTAARFNEVLKSIDALEGPAETALVVRGTVSDFAGKPIKGAVVRAFDRDLRKQPLLGEAKTDEKGQYIISYGSSQFGFGDEPSAQTPQLIVRAFFNDQQVGSDVMRPNPTSEEVVDFQVSTSDLSEWERLSTAILPLLQDQGEGNRALSPWEITESDLRFIAERTFLNREQIRLWSLAFVVGRDRSNAKPPEDSSSEVIDHAFPLRGIVNGQLTYSIFYGWFRLGLPSEVSALWATPSENLLSTIKSAVEQRLVPQNIVADLDGIRSLVEEIKRSRIQHPAPVREVTLNDVLDTIPGGFSVEKKALVAKILGDKTDKATSLNSKLNNAGLTLQEASAVERTLAFQKFSANFLPLIETLQNEGVPSLRELALTTNKEALTRKILEGKAHPDDITPQDFAEGLYAKLFNAEPTAVVRNLLGDSSAFQFSDNITRTDVATVLSNLPETFDLKTTSVYEAFKHPDAFNGIPPERQEKAKAELKSLQRVAAISTHAEVIAPLMKANLTSALLISDQPEEQFVAALSKEVDKDGETVARQVYANAVNARVRNEHALLALKQVKQGSDVSMIDKSVGSHLDDLNDLFEQNNLSWDLLFGDADLCECGECTSVYSAANYFVELLQYLRNNNLDPAASGSLAIKTDPKDISKTPLQKLFNRRPDLQCLQLTCANTNTLLPYVDLVNEVMESYVVFHKTLPFNVSEDETSDELLAQPKHTEYKAYEHLHEAVYPFQLPYHQPIDAARTYLNYLRTSRCELIDTFRSVRNRQFVLDPLTGPGSPLIAPSSPAFEANLNSHHEIYLERAVDAEYLGLTQEEYIILTKEAFVSKEYWDAQVGQPHSPNDYLNKIGAKPVHEYYGYPSDSSMLNDDEAARVGLTFVKDQFLKRTGLQYLELVELLKTQSINSAVPKTKALSIMNRVQLSYRYLQTLVNHSPHVSLDEKLLQVMQAIALITNPQVVASIDQLLGIADPCGSPDGASPVSTTDIKRWVELFFEKIGKIIVLDNGVRCIDGKLSFRLDNLVDTGIRIVNCQIIGANGQRLGSIDKATGLVTVNDGQLDGDWSKIVFTGSKGEQGSFINSPGGIFFVIPAPVDNCDLETVRLNHLDGTPLTAEEYDRIHRFIRLWRKLGWTIQETDDALAGLGLGNNFDLSPQLLHRLGSVKKLAQKFGIELGKLLPFWTNIGTAGPKSLYKRLFLTHNPVDAFREDANGRYLADPTLQLQDYAPTLMGALNLKSDELAAIMSYTGIRPLTLESVSQLYRYRLLAKLLGISVTELVDALPLFTDPFSSPEATVAFVENWSRIEDAGFDYRLLNYIIKAQDDSSKPVALNKRSAFQLAKTLYDGLNAIQEENQDLSPGTVATPDLVKQKATLIYDQKTVDNILGLLEGTNVYSATCPADVKDLLRPIPLVPPATTQDYEFLQLDNYPLVRSKVTYDRKSGSLQIKGVLTDLEEKGSSLFVAEDFINASALVNKLVDPASDAGTRAVSEFLWTTFSATDQATLSDATADQAQHEEVLLNGLNNLIQGPSIAAKFSSVGLSTVTSQLLGKNPIADDLIRLNRLLLEDTYPLSIARNKRIGFKTIRENLQPALSLNDPTNAIANQLSNLFNDTFSADFAAFKQDCLAGDENDQPVDPVTGIDNNTAPMKCARFLALFLPYLRKELTRRLIINTLSAQTTLSNDITELLLTNILQARKSPNDPLQPLYQFFVSINEPTTPVSTRWYGSLIPAVAGDYRFFVKGSNTQPNLSIDGNQIAFVSQAGSPQGWSSGPLELLAGKVYQLTLVGLGLESVYWKSGTSAIANIPTGSLLPAFAEDTTTKAFAQLQRAALLIIGFTLSADEIQYFSNNATDFGNLNFNALTLDHFLRLEAYTRLRNSLPIAKLNLFEFLSWTASNPGTPPGLNQKIEDLAGWKRDRVTQLTQQLHFNLLTSESFRNESNLLKLQKALVIADRIGVSIDVLFDWANPSSDFFTCRTIADAIEQAIRAQHSQDDWEEAIKPLSDALRTNQRDALIAYLLVQPEIINWGVTDADGLFEYFLIDVQMDPCMETSRIVQAISSVQLFIQRCLLGLEEQHSGISPALLDRGRWEWMQRYRVWEANRKVFLYPENWIESNLRDDKSSFFKELESELLQKDINKQNVEDALKAYLYKVDEVANMEVVGLYVEKVPYTESGYTYEKGVKLHVFSRTRNAPYGFYYRWLDLVEGNWYPWEKIQVDIPSYDREDVVEVTKVQGANTYKSNPNFKQVISNGCFLTPVVWNDRLLIFFPQFMRKTKPNDDVADSKSIVDLSEDSTSSSHAIEYWEIKMAWSEYRNGKWTPKQLSKDAIYDMPGASGFWKAFNDYQKATSKAEAALKKTSETGAVYNRERDKFVALLMKSYSKPVSIFLNSPQLRDTNNDRSAYDIGGTAVDANNSANNFSRTLDTSHPFIMAWVNLLDANQSLMEAQSDLANATGVLSNSPLPNFLPDISRYVFVSVPSDTGNLLGIQVEYARDVNGNNQHDVKGTFEFDGSVLTAHPTLSYTYDRQLGAIGIFSHYNSNIISLQENDFVSQLFNDGGPTTYTLEPLNDAYTISFHHSDARSLLGVINTQSLESFFKFPNEGVGRNTDKDDVFGGYDEDSNTQTANIYHELKRPYSLYNWELFFHTPMMLADALSKSQQFEEAMKWHHFVFNPIAEGSAVNRFWQFSPLKDTDGRRILDHIFNNLKPNQPNAEINEWRNNPFAPHVVARSRPVAYMKWVVMKYVDNLIAWGDSLFRQDTIESINQATQLYVLAGHILGPRPQTIPKRGKARPETYLSLLGRWDAFSNAMVELELALPFSSQTTLAIGVGKGTVGLANIFGFASSTYFCIPNNPKLMGYWDTIGDRLFKIRHCQNIQGTVRQLPLFQPPIDPALLVKAAAQGLSIASVLNDLNTPMPNYRFYYFLQKALELCAELKSMGNAMLSALEKKDNEELARIRARHESGMQTLLMDVRTRQLDEAQKTLEGLQQNRRSPEHRMRYYLNLIGEDLEKVPVLDSDFAELANPIETPVDESGLKLIKFEKEDMDKSSEAAGWQIGIGVTETLAGILNIIPVFAADVKPFGMGAGGSFGGSNLGSAASAIARGMQTYSANLSFQSSSAGKKGGFLRSLQERVMQANSAGYEIKQIDKQILAQQIRIDIANTEIRNQQQQIDNAEEVEEFLKNKYTNQELYAWMKESLGGLYHQVYALAFELAKKAEKLFQFERGVTGTSYIQPGYWDASYNGLLAGEQLYVGLKQLESAYHENRGYDYEITKHVSLRQINPISLLELKQSGRCEFSLPEVLFDVDYPGHYKRRIKSVSLTIPCVAGPYVGLNGSLRLLENKIRNSSMATNYPEKTDEPDDRFLSYIVPINSIAASSGQNDSGMFELNFKDERYLPFEGAGAISKWRFELPTPLRQFNYDTIADVVVHIRYTSSEGGAALKMEAQKSVAGYIGSVEQSAMNEGLFVILDLKHDFSTQWHQLFNQNRQTVSWELTHVYFPYLFNGRELEIVGARVFLKPRGDSPLPPLSSGFSLNGSEVSSWTINQSNGLIEGTIDLGGSPIRTWTLDRGAEPLPAGEVDDLFIAIQYRVV